jgi:hypothetical protein
MRTLLLDTDVWDLVLDSNGNIAVADDPYALAQDVASAIKLFQGELFYDTTKGVPYFTQIFGQLPPTGIITQFMEKAAQTVPEVANAQCTIQSFNSRSLTGTVEFPYNGQTVTVNF